MRTRSRKRAITRGEENHLDSEDGYDIAVYPDYYGEEYSIEFANPSKLQRDLDKWHARNCLDAKDRVGLYLASKGHDPRKVNSVKLMKKHLKNAVPREELEKVSTMRVERVLYSDVPAVRSADAIPSLPSAVLADHGVRGILIKDGGAYKVVDGGGSSSTPSRGSSGLFIVLE